MPDKKTGVETLDSRGRINLARYGVQAGDVFLMETQENGRIILTPAEVVPKGKKS